MVTNNQSLVINGINTNRAEFLFFGNNLLINKKHNDGYLADIRLWDKVLNNNEITIVSKFGTVSSGLLSSYDGTVINDFDRKILIDSTFYNNHEIFGENVIINYCDVGIVNINF